MKTKRAAAVFALLVPGIANGAIIDFEGVIPAGLTRVGDPIFPYSEDGFVFNDVSSGADNALFGPSASTNDNGTDVLGWISGSAFSLSAVSGQLFSLTSFDATNLDPTGMAGGFDVTGMFGAGGSISASLPNTLNTFSTYTFGTLWTRLASVEIRNFGMTNGAIDNIVVNTVPEPATLGLLALGVAGLAYRQRKPATT